MTEIAVVGEPDRVDVLLEAMGRVITGTRTFAAMTLLAAYQSCRIGPRPAARGSL